MKRAASIIAALALGVSGGVGLSACGGGDESSNTSGFYNSTTVNDGTTTIESGVAPTTTTETPTGPTPTQARAAARDLDSQLKAATKAAAYKNVYDCVKKAAGNGLEALQACIPSCQEGVQQCGEDAKQLTKAFKASPDYVQKAYQSAYDAALKALEKEAEFSQAMGDFLAGGPYASEAEAAQALDKALTLGDEAKPKILKAFVALQTARSDFREYLNGLTP